jgi:histidinol dehydrogenase
LIQITNLQAEDDLSAVSLPRAVVDAEQVMGAVRNLAEEVRHGGAEAILRISERLDGVRPPSLRVPSAAIADARARLAPNVTAALEESIRRARAVHSSQRPEDHVCHVVTGGTVTNRWLPVRRVGLYVPGGRAVYLSSVVMNVVPAQEAGVSSLAIASPPQRDNGGLPHPEVLAAAGLLGVDEVYAVGGAQAVAMFAYGARAADGAIVCGKADLVTGPGNIWVTAAKRLVKGTVGIDSEAGPTEIAILADESADPVWVAADLISQAEHDDHAAAVLITASERLAEAVIRSLQEQVPATKHSERIRTALSGPQSRILLVRDLEAGLRLADAYAAEHLEIHTRDAAALASRVRNAGAIFVGAHSPVSLGDYCAGSNHVLPTGGCACHSSGLSVQSFLRQVQVVEYDRAALQQAAGFVDTLANAEDLPAHAQAVSARFGGVGQHRGTGRPRQAP